MALLEIGLIDHGTYADMDRMIKGVSEEGLYFMFTFIDEPLSPGRAAAFDALPPVSESPWAVQLAKQRVQHAVP